MGERETCSLIASDGPCSRSIARLKAKDDALTPAPIHLTFGQVDLEKNRKPRWGYLEPHLLYSTLRDQTEMKLEKIY